MTLCPVSFADAARHHRRHRAPQGHKFSIGVQDDGGELVGVIVVGKPVPRQIEANILDVAGGRYWIVCEDRY